MRQARRAAYGLTAGGRKVVAMRPPQKILGEARNDWGRQRGLPTAYLRAAEKRSQSGRLRKFSVKREKSTGKGGGEVRRASEGG